MRVDCEDLYGYYAILAIYLDVIGECYIAVQAIQNGALIKCRVYLLHEQVEANSHEEVTTVVCS